MPRVVPILQPDRRRESRNVDEHDASLGRPTRDALVECLNHRKRGAGFKSVKASKQRLERRHDRLHENRRRHEGAQALDDLPKLLKRLLDLVFSGCARRGALEEAQHPGITDNQRHVEAGGADWARRVRPVDQRAVEFAFEGLDQ